jgi:hypothetical protein
MKNTKNDPNVNFGMYEKDRVAKRNAQTVTGEGKLPRVTIKFESVSGKSLQSRFNTLARYYSNSDSPEQWIAEEFKKRLIANIERGTVVVARDGHKLGFA